MLTDLIDRGRIKQAQAILQYRLNVSREQSIKLQQDNMKLNAQNGQAIEQAKMQKELMKLKMAEQKEIRVEAAKALFSMEVSKNEALNRVKESLIMEVLGGGQQQPTEGAPAQ